jgi:hypothetical protein
VASKDDHSILSKGADVIGDWDEGVIILLVIAVIAASLGGSFFIIYQAPEILFEAAFEALLVAGLVRRAKQMKSEGWVFSIFKRTWLPFVIVLGLAITLGFIIRHKCPEAVSFSEYREMCWGKE